MGVNVHGFLHIQYPVVDQPCNVLVCTCISAKKLIESVKVVKYSSKMIHTSCQIKCMTLWSTITEDQEVTVGNMDIMHLSLYTGTLKYERMPTSESNI